MGGPLAAACLARPRPSCGSASCLPAVPGPGRRRLRWALSSSLSFSGGRRLFSASPLLPHTPFLLPVVTGGGGAARRAERSPAASLAHGLTARRALGGRRAPVGRPPRLFPEEGEAQLPPPPLRLPPPPPPRLLPPSRPPLGASGARSHRGAQTGPAAAAALTHNGAETHQQGERGGSSSACPFHPPTPVSLLFFSFFFLVNFYFQFSVPVAQSEPGGATSRLTRKKCRGDESFLLVGLFSCWFWLVLCLVGCPPPFFFFFFWGGDVLGSFFGGVLFSNLFQGRRLLT